MPKKHKIIVDSLTKKYAEDKNVIGIQLFGSLAIGKAKETSDVDIEIIFKKRKKPYELISKKVNGIHIDLSCFSLKGFLKEFYEKTHLTYSILNKHKIIYDPKGILKKAFANTNKYFKENPKIEKFWKKKEKKYILDKKLGRKKENFFDVCKEAKELMNKNKTHLPNPLP